MRLRVVSSPHCRDVVFPYKQRLTSINELSFFVGLVLGRVSCIEGEVPDMKRVFYGPVVAVEVGPQRLAEQGFGDMDVLDLMAESFLESGVSSYDIKSSSLYIVLSGGETIHVVKIALHKKQVRIRREGGVYVYDLPDNLKDRHGVIDGLNIKWWSLARAVSTIYFQGDEAARAFKAMMNSKMKRWVLVGVQFPSIRQVGLIANKHTGDRLVFSGKDGDDYRVLARLMAVDELYHEVKFQHKYIIDYREYYYSPKHNRGLWEQAKHLLERKAISPVDIRRVGEQYRLMLGNGVWLKMLSGGRLQGLRDVSEYLFLEIEESADRDYAKDLRVLHVAPNDPILFRIVS